MGSCENAKSRRTDVSESRIENRMITGRAQYHDNIFGTVADIHCVRWSVGVIEERQGPPRDTEISYADPTARDSLMV